jgi:endonuclease G, mitochondrial
VTDLSAATDPLTDRTGYDPTFLGPEVPVPALATPEPTVLLHYLHYSVLLRPDRRFAAVTALCMDGARLIQIDRDSDRWLFDPRVPREQQAGKEIYEDNDLDRGHLVRRTSAVWGDTVEEAQRANDDTFYWTNAAPQAGAFNKGKALWLGLEDFVQRHADTFDRKLAVLAGPVLDVRDPPYRGVQVPLRFWKVVAFVQDGALAATGYLLDQSPLVDDLGAAFDEAAAAGEAPPLGAFRTFQVPIADIAALSGVVLDQLVAVDRMPVPPADVAPAPGQAAGGWVQLRELSDIAL